MASPVSVCCGTDAADAAGCRQRRPVAALGRQHPERVLYEPG